MEKDWQSQLETHFRELRQQRDIKQPIFGLEHGLTPDEFQALAVDIQNDLPRWKQRLAWIVYASELGYEYSGDEYWQTFESRTPNWSLFGDRHWIRDCFLDFHENYGGARPTGAWAEKFSIICWPITHAILPRDLQRQLAHILFDLRYFFTSEILQEPKKLGELIAGSSWRASPRFQQLTEEPSFIGQIAAALLLKGERLASSLVLPSTLDRISLDLDRESKSKSWLLGARQTAQKEFRFPTIVKRQVHPADEEKEREPKKAFSLQPRMLLRPYDAASWEVVIDLPDLSLFCTAFPNFQKTLSSSLCYLNGSSGRPLPPGFLLYGSQQVNLIRWPSESEPLLTFEPSVPELDLILKTECGITPGSSWLFKIASDGVAYQINSRQVLAGHKYIFLTKDSQNLSTNTCFHKVNIRCANIHGLLIELPPVISLEASEALEKLALQQAKIIRVWPAGLIPPKWDREGYAECLSTEQMSIAIAADHPVGTYCVEYDSERFFMSPEALDLPLFLEISDLEPGSHLLRVSSADDNDDTSLTSGSLEIYARRPRIWSPSLTNYGAFMVIVQPTVPSLEELWDGTAKVELFGPISKAVKWSIAFFQKGKSEPSFSYEPPPFSLPVYARNWEAHLSRLKDSGQDHKKIWNAYNYAYSCKLTFDANELGTYVLSTDRAFAPLRWGISRNKEQVFLKLIDDSGIQSGLDVYHYDYSDPDISHSCDAGQFLRSDGSPVTSGLYIARLPAFKSAILVPQEIHSLSDLTISPQFLWRPRDPRELSELVRVSSDWAGAYLFGSRLSSIFKAQIVNLLTAKIISLIAGTKWRDTERLVFNNPAELSPEDICKPIFKNSDEIDLAITLFKEVDRFAALTPRRRTQFFSQLLGLYHSRLSDKVSKERRDSDAYIVWLSEYALRLASSDKSIADWAGGNLIEANSWLLHFPSLILLSRLLVSLVQKAIVNSDSNSNQYPGWQWD